MLKNPRHLAHFALLFAAILCSSSLLESEAAPFQGGLDYVAPSGEQEEEPCDDIKDGPEGTDEIPNDCAGAVPPGQLEESGSGPPSPSPGPGGVGTGGGNPATPASGGGSPGIPSSGGGATAYGGPGNPISPGSGMPGAGGSPVTAAPAPGVPGSGGTGPGGPNTPSTGGGIGTPGGPGLPWAPEGEGREPGDDGTVSVDDQALGFTVVDEVYQGIGQGLIIGRHYHGRLGESRFDNNVGNGWFHSLQERLVALDSDGAGKGRIAHLDWGSPFADPTTALLETSVGSGEYASPAFKGKELEVLGTPYSGNPYGSAFELTYQDGRIHYFDEAGQVVARVNQSGADAITFEYNATTGALETVTDTRGQEFTIATSLLTATAKYSIVGVTDPLGNEIEYVIGDTTGELGEVVQASVTFHENGYDGSGDPLTTAWGSTTTAETSTTYLYSDYGELETVLNNSGAAVLQVIYQDENTGNPGPTNAVWMLEQASGADWVFEPGTNGPYSDSLLVTDPRGFQREYYFDTAEQPIEIRQSIASTDPSTPERAGSGFHTWELEWDTSCGCGRLLKIVEPGTGGIEYFHDSSGNLLRIEEIPNDSSSDRRIWTWTYDSLGRVTSYLDPVAHDATTPADYKYTYTYIDLPGTHTLAPNGTEITVSTPAGGIHGSDVEWAYVFDEHDRFVEYTGPDVDANDSGLYRRVEYVTSAGAAYGLIDKVVDASDDSIWTQYTYNANGRITTITTQAGTLYENDWDDQNRLTGWIGPDRGSQQYEAQWLYDAEGRVSSVRYKYYEVGPSATGTDPYTWIGTRFWYNDSGQLLHEEWDITDDVSQANIGLESYEYDLAGNLHRMEDADGYVVEAIYDELELLWTSTRGVGTASPVTEEYTYSSAGDLALYESEFEGTPFSISYSNDKWGYPSGAEMAGYFKVTVETDALGRVNQEGTYGFDGSSFVLNNLVTKQRTDWHGAPTYVTEAVYDSAGAAVLRTVGSEASYSPSGLPITLEINGATVTTFDYDSLGRPISISGPEGSSESLAYNSSTGYLDSVVTYKNDPVGGGAITATESYVRDVAGRLLQVTLSAAGETPIVQSYKYDSLNNIVEFVDGEGVVSQTKYRWDSSPVSVDKAVDTGTGVADSTETYTYSPSGKILTATDNRSNTVEWQYDEHIRPEFEIQPDGSYWAYDYNEAGLATQVTTPTGRTLAYTYNTAGWPTTRIFKDALGVIERTDTYTWDDAGFLEQVVKIEGGLSSTVSFTRDSQGLPLSEAQDGNTVDYTYDTWARVTQIEGPNTTLNYGYDSLHRVSVLKDAGLNTLFTREYLGTGGTIRRETRGDGSTLNHLRDGFGRLTELQTKQGSLTVGVFAYAWNSDNTVRYEHRRHQSSGDVYRYDELKRLTKFIRNSDDPVAEWASSGSSVWVDKTTYGLDADGHRTAVAVKPYGGFDAITSYTTAALRHHYTNVGGAARTSNADGNVTTHGNRSFVYDASFNLVEVKDSGVTVATYEYDALDRRIRKNVGGVATRYVYAGEWIIEEYETVGAGGEVQVGQYYHATGIDDVIMSRRLDQNDLDQDGLTTDYVDLYLHKNLAGSTMTVTLGSGIPVEYINYDAYGKPTFRKRGGVVLAASRTGIPFMFTGREYDEETGYYHYRARAYDPATGTFLQEDPLGFYDGLNPVAYVGGNPITRVDPMGMNAVTDAVEGVIDFIKQNKDLIGELIVDAIAPLAAVADAISAATGLDITGWIASGFQSLDDLSWWERLMSAGSAIAGLGGVVKTVAKLDDIYDNLKALAKNAKRAKAEAKAAAAAETAGNVAKKAPNCFVAGTLLLVAPAYAIPIEDVDIGMNIPTSIREERELDTSELGPEDPDYYDVIEPDYWRQVDMEIVDAYGRVAKIRALRPLPWFEKFGTKECGSVPFVSGEFHLDGVARITNIGPCPESARDGIQGSRTVVTTVQRIAPDIWTLELEGEAATIEITGTHVVYSMSQDRWVQAMRLLPGELVVSAEGTLHVVADMTPRRGIEPVWNLEVHRGHSYFVGEQSVLVHNHSPRRRPEGWQHGGGKNSRHKNFDAKGAAESKWREAQLMLEEARRRGASAKEKRELRRRVRHLQNKMDEVGESHNLGGPKGNNGGPRS